MLKRFSVTNYRGFYDTLVWDLTASGYEFNSHVVRDGVLKNAVIFGENGTGKSNLGLALFDIVYHLSDKHKHEKHYKNYISLGRESELVQFEYIFVFDAKEMVYTYSKDKDGRLQSECLRYDDKLSFSWKEGEVAYVSQEFPIDEERKQEILFPDNENKASLAKFLYSSMRLESGHYLIKLKDFVDRMLWFKSLDERDFTGLDPTPRNIHTYIIRNGLLVDFSNFLSELSQQSFDFSPTKKEDDSLYCEINGTVVEFRKIASTGTNVLVLLYFWYKQMDKASLVFIDEFDAFYHYRLSCGVCEKLFRLEHTQVFLSSHDTFLMDNDLLRPDAYYLINGKQVKALNNLTDKELREAHCLEKLYRGGAFHF